MESFGAKFPRIYLDSGFKGWFVSTLLLSELSKETTLKLQRTNSIAAAWFGSLVNGPIADRFGRKWSIEMAVVIFTVGSAIQAGAVSVGMIFAGKNTLTSPVWSFRSNLCYQVVPLPVLQLECSP